MLCPECGEDNTPKEAMDTSKKLTMVIIALVALIAVLVGIIVMGMGGMDGGEDTTGAPETTAAPATTPADGNPDDATCKGTYTAAAQKVMEANTEVVATMGEHTLTNGELQVYYWVGIYNFLDYNGYYLAGLGLDLTRSLDTQVCTLEGYEKMTWQQYFLSEALQTWQRYMALTADAESVQFQLAEDYAEALKNLEANLEAAAKEDGYENIQGMMDDQLGGGCVFADYESYMYQYYMGYLYYDSLCSEIDVSEDEIKAFFEENKDAYAAKGLTEDYMFYDVRHVLIEPVSAEGAETYTDEEWEACRVKAQGLLDAWLADGGTEEGFADMAKEHSADSNADKGGIYEDLSKDTNFVPEFKAWYVDESRVPGDSGLVKTVYGYHLMYFVGSEPAWPAYAEGDLVTTRQNEILDEAVAKHPMEVDYSKIWLGDVVLASAS